MAMACQVARQKLAMYVDSLKQGGAAEKTGAVIKAGMIGGISAPAKGLVGNLAWGGFRTLAQQPVEAGMDYIQSVARSAKTGFKVKPHELREVVSALDADGLKAYGSGFKKGAALVKQGMDAGKKAMQALPPGTPFAERIAAYTDELSAYLNADKNAVGMNNPTTRIQSPGWRAFTQGAFAAVEAVDRPFFVAAGDMSIYMQAKLAAVKQGLKSSDPRFKAEVDALMKNPTDEMKLRALDDAMYATFKDKPQIALVIERGRKALQSEADKATGAKKAGAMAASVGMDLVMPFTGVPSSIVAKAASLSPLGLVSPKMVGTQAQRSQALANVAIGSSMIALGYQMAKDGRLTGAASSASNERADNDLTRANYSVKLGDQWVDIRTLGPVAIPLFVGAAMARKTDKEPDASATDLALTGAGSIGKSVVENSFLQGTKRAIEAVQEPEGKGAAFAAGLVPIPALLGQVSRAVDDTPREAKTVGERLMARTPLSLLLPEKQTPTGTAPEKTLGERLSPFSPLGVKQDRDTPAFKELRRLGLALGMPERTTSINNKKVEIPREQYAQMLESQGRLLERLNALISDETGPYNRMSDEQKKNYLRKRLEFIRDTARKPVRSELLRTLVGNE